MVALIATMTSRGLGFVMVGQKTMFISIFCSVKEEDVEVKRR